MATVATQVTEYGRQQKIGSVMCTTFKLVSDGTPAAVTLTHDNHRPIERWQGEGLTITQSATSRSQVSVAAPPANSTRFVELYG